jgi:hypothetical protein
VSDVTIEEWERRFKDRIFKRCVAAGWTESEADSRAEDEYEALCEYDTSKGPPAPWAKPESEADESLSYDEDDGDE